MSISFDKKKCTARIVYLRANHNEIRYIKNGLHLYYNDDNDGGKKKYNEKVKM